MVTSGDEVKSVLIVGGGSIGKRHLTNLLDKDSIETFYVVTKNKQYLDAIQYSDRIIVRDSLRGIQADIAVIANETHKHLDTAIQLASCGMHLFIEKPISHNRDHFEDLKNLVEKYNLKVFIAYNMRFLKAFSRLREIIADNTIGELYFAQIEVGQYLPSWRPERDYRSSYSAFRKKGGGVSLDLSHEIDYMRYLFGDPVNWKVLKTKVSNLEIDSDDLFEGIYVFENQFICNVHLDYLQQEKKRIISIVGSGGTVRCDLINKRIDITTISKKQAITEESLFDTNKTYLDEMDHFLEVVENGFEPMITLNDGIKILELLEDKNDH